MAKWVSQREVSSTTARSRERTAYLDPIRPAVESVVKTYLAERPDAEDVTVEVFAQIGKKRLKQASGQEDLKRLRQDLGLLVAITLVDVFGAARVLTLRDEDGDAVSTRRNTRADLDWVSRFTPHRVLAEPSVRDRILLDTGTVRKILHGDADALDPAELDRIRGDRLVSIADGALAEVAAALLDERLPIAMWSANIAKLDVVLDPEAPVFPGGMELATLAGLRPPPHGFSVESSLAYYRAAWRLLRDAQTKDDLDRPGEYIDGAGVRFRIRLDHATVKAALAEAETKWSSWVEDAGNEFRKLRGTDDEPDQEELRTLIRRVLRLDGMSDGQLDKLDLAIRVIALRSAEAGTGKAPYKPKGPNDAIDFDLLFGVALPALICTSDDRLVRLAARTESADAKRVMLPKKLIANLAT